MLVSSRASLHVAERQNERRLDEGRRSACGLKSGSSVGVSTNSFRNDCNSRFQRTNRCGAGCERQTWRMERETKNTRVRVVRCVMLMRPVKMDVDGIRLFGIRDGSRRRKSQLRGERQKRQHRRAEGFPF